jgi:hypothetical protein
LLHYFEQKIKANEIIVLDKVCDESKYVAKGVILEKLNIMNDYKVNTKELLPDQKYFRQLENEFCYGAMKNKLTDAEFESQKMSI